MQRRTLLLGFLVLLIILAGGYYYFFRGGEQLVYSFDSCPVFGQDCQKFELAKENGQIVGFGYRLPEGTKVYSPVSGKLSFDKASILLGKDISPSSEDTALVRITDPRGYWITLYFKGTTIAQTSFDVPAGTLMGRTAEGISKYGGLNLVIKVQRVGSGLPLPLNPESLLKDAKDPSQQ